MTVVQSASGPIEGRLLDFRAVSLNNDDTGQILARIDVSGRNLVRDLALVDHPQGIYRCEFVPDAGYEIRVWHNGERNLIVAQQPVFELHRTDPTSYFPLLYAWTGGKCGDVSGQNKSYYAAQVQPELEREITRCLSEKVDDSSESRLDALMDGLALKARRLAKLFPELAIAPDLTAKLSQLLMRLTRGLPLEAPVSEALRLVIETKQTPTAGVVPGVPESTLPPPARPPVSTAASTQAGETAPDAARSETRHVIIWAAAALAAGLAVYALKRK